MQVMLLDSSVHLSPPVLVIPLPSDVMLLGTGMGSPSGEWVGAVIVPWYTAQQVPHLHVDQAVPLQLYLGQSLEQQILLPIHQH